MRVVRAVVLDEADQLMKSDFEDQTLSILQLITSSCLQRIVVSATVTQNLRSAILPLLQNPIEVTISDIERLNSSLHYHFIWTEENQKRNRFQALLKSIAKDNPSHLQLPLVVTCQSRFAFHPILMYRLETVEAKTVLEAFSPSLRFRCVTVETPADARRTALTQLGDGSLDVLVATMGIVGRGVELRRCRSVGACGACDVAGAVVPAVVHRGADPPVRTHRTRRGGGRGGVLLQREEQEGVQGAGAAVRGGAHQAAEEWECLE